MAKPGDGLSQAGGDPIDRRDRFTHHPRLVEAGEIFREPEEVLNQMSSEPTQAPEESAAEQVFGPPATEPPPLGEPDSTGEYDVTPPES